jgi:hypothetical protein
MRRTRVRDAIIPERSGANGRSRMSHDADVPEADAAEQERAWDEHEESPPKRHIPPDAPEADFLDQMRDADLEDEDRQ